MHQETAFFDHTKTGELVNRLSADTALVSQAVTANISDGLRSTVMALAGVGMMVRVVCCGEGRVEGEGEMGKERVVIMVLMYR